MTERNAEAKEMPHSRVVLRILEISGDFMGRELSFMALSNVHFVHFWVFRDDHYDHSNQFIELVNIHEYFVFEIFKTNRKVEKG